MSSSIKIHRLAAKRLYFIADAHLNDKTSWTKVFLPLRGFKDIKENDQKVRGDLAALPAGSTVINLGDFHCGTAMELTKVFTSLPNITTWYHVDGNHDVALDKFRSSWKPYKLWYGGDKSLRFERDGIVQDHHFFGNSAMIRVQVKVRNQLVWLAHYAHLVWPEWRDSWHLCGHSHGREASINPDRAMALRLDLGVENALRISRFDRWSITGRQGPRPLTENNIASTSTLFSWDLVIALMAKQAKRIKNHGLFGGGWSRAQSLKVGDRVMWNGELITIGESGP